MSGLIRILPLARSKLHYEHCAPHDYPLAEGQGTALIDCFDDGGSVGALLTIFDGWLGGLAA